ncbi:MAG: TlpA family protein disulfide reductase [Phycisphaerales bacterium]
MRKRALASLAAAVAVFGIAVSAFGVAPKVGDRMPALKIGELYNNDGGLLDPKDLEGYVVVVEFWATWCGPCRRSIPHLNKLHNDLKDDGVVFIGLSNEDPGTVQKFMKQTRMDYFVVAASASGQDYGVSGIPAAFIVKPDGVIAWKGNPLDSQFDKKLHEVIKSTPPTRSLGRGADYNAYLLERMEASIRMGAFSLASRDLGRVDHEALPETPEHQKRYEAVKVTITNAAQSAFDRAASFEKQGDLAGAMVEYSKVMTEFAGLDVAKKATDAVKRIERDPAYQDARRSELLERHAANGLERANRLAEAGRHVLAYKKLKSVVEKYSGTEAAEEAQTLIDKYEADEQFMKELRDSGG